MIRHVTIPDLLFPASSPLSHAVIDDRYVYLAGLAAGDLPEGRDAVGDVRAETEKVMARIEKTLADLGLGIDRVVRVDVHLADLAEIHAMNEVYGRYFAAGKYPARTCTESAKIVGGCRVEITCVARL